MPRLFVALETPAHAAAPLLATLPRDRAIRAVPAPQLHLTLRFVGEVDDDLAARIDTALAGIAAGGFALRLAGAGRFGRGGGILWAGVERSVPLLRLQGDIEARLVATGIAPETRPFHPHVTLARCRPGAPESMLRGWVERLREWRAEPFVVRRFLLMESRLLPGGAEHRCRQAFALRNGVGSEYNPT